MRDITQQSVCVVGDTICGRCEPEKHPPPKFNRGGAVGGGAGASDGDGGRGGGEERPARSRTVTVPVAVSRATLTAARLAALVALGAEWAADLGPAAASAAAVAAIATSTTIGGGGGVGVGDGGGGGWGGGGGGGGGRGEWTGGDELPSVGRVIRIAIWIRIATSSTLL